jgi:uncharacterized protein YciI
MHFFCKLIGPRPTFPADITDAEKALMQQHAQYLTGLLNQGTISVFGPVMDPKGPFGMAVVEAASAEEVQRLTANDPVVKASAGFKYEISPMRANIRGTAG